MRLDPDMQAIADEVKRAMQTGEAFEPLDESRISWERRRENELTPDYLGRVCEWAELPMLAVYARAAHYDDYQCPSDVADGLENLRFIRDLRRNARALPEGEEYREARERIDALDYAYRHGEFDATKAESDRWAASEGGQAAFRALTQDAVPKVGRNDPCPCGSGRKYKHCHGA